MFKLRSASAAWLMSLSCLVLPISVVAKPAPAPVNLIKIYKYQSHLLNKS